MFLWTDWPLSCRRAGRPCPALFSEDTGVPDHPRLCRLREGAPREGTRRGALRDLSPPLTPSPPLCSHPAWLPVFLDPAPLGVREQWDGCLDRRALGTVAQLLPGREGGRAGGRAGPEAEGRRGSPLVSAHLPAVAALLRPPWPHPGSCESLCASSMHRPECSDGCSVCSGTQALCWGCRGGGWVVRRPQGRGHPTAPAGAASTLPHSRACHPLLLLLAVFTKPQCECSFLLSCILSLFTVVKYI